MKTSFLTKCLPTLEKELIEKIEAHSILKEFNPGDYIVEQGKNIRFLPIVLNGSVKVFITEDTTPFLLYFITTGETCIYSFAHTYNDTVAEFSATAETKCELLLLPLFEVQKWLQQYPSFNHLVLRDYQKQYFNLLTTTKQITLSNLDERLMIYLLEKSKILADDEIGITHQEIANDLGTSREVISRLLKKLSAQGKIEQVGRKIKVL